MLFKSLIISFITLAAVASAQPLNEVHRLAQSVLSQAQIVSFMSEREYCGYIGFNTSGKLVATPPLQGDENGCMGRELPQGFFPLASYHTHGSYSDMADTETPSVDDLKADFSEGVDGYVATPGGRLWFNSLDDGTTTLLCENGCVPRDPLFQSCPAMKPEPYYTVDTLKKREELDELGC